MLNGDRGSYMNMNMNMLTPTFTSSKIKTIFKLMSKFRRTFVEFAERAMRNGDEGSVNETHERRLPAVSTISPSTLSRNRTTCSTCMVEYARHWRRSRSP